MVHIPTRTPSVAGYIRIDHIRFCPDHSWWHPYWWCHDHTPYGIMPIAYHTYSANNKIIFDCIGSIPSLMTKNWPNTHHLSWLYPMFHLIKYYPSPPMISQIWWRCTYITSPLSIPEPGFFCRPKIFICEEPRNPISNTENSHVGGSIGRNPGRKPSSPRHKIMYVSHIKSVMYPIIFPFMCVCVYIYIYGGFHKWGSPKWMVYKGKSQ